MEAMHMKRKRWWIGVLLGAAVLLCSPVVGAVESDPLPVPKKYGVLTPREIRRSPLHKMRHAFFKVFAVEALYYIRDRRI